MITTSVMHTVEVCLYVECVCMCVHVCLKKNLNAPRPSEHPPVLFKKNLNASKPCIHIQICVRVHRDWCFEAFVDDTRSRRRPTEQCSGKASVCTAQEVSLRIAALAHLQEKAPRGGSPYLQHRVATLLVQHGRRHQNHPTRNHFLKSCRFRLCLVQAAVVNLFVLNLVCFISVCPCIPETGRLENTYSSCCGIWLWCWLAAVLSTLFVLNLLCFISVYCTYIPETRNGQIIEHVRTQRRNKKDLAPQSRARGSTWGLFLQVC